MKPFAIAFVAAGIILAPVQLRAQETATSEAPVIQNIAALDIEGFRSAKFGMAPEQVRGAIANDFGADLRVEAAENPTERTGALVVQLTALEPGSGPAAIAYIFGARSKTLMHVNVTWTSGAAPSQAERDEMMRAGLQLVAYFRQQNRQATAEIVGTPAGPNALSLYAAADAKGATVEIIVEGISFEMVVDGRPTPSPAPAGPTSLRISYALNAADPDIYRIPPKSF